MFAKTGLAKLYLGEDFNILSYECCFNQLINYIFLF